MDRRGAASFHIQPAPRNEPPPGSASLPRVTPKGRSMLQILRRRRALAMALTAAAASASIAYGAGSGPLSASAQGGGGANIDLFRPTSGDRSGLDGKVFFVDLKADMNLPLERSGFGGQGPA